MSDVRRWTAQEIARAMAGATRSTARSSGGSWICRCPAHNDVGESLSCKDFVDRGGEQKVLFNCFAGCTFVDIVRGLRGFGIDIPPSRPRNKDWKRAPLPANAKPIEIKEAPKEWLYAPERASERPFTPDQISGTAGRNIRVVYDWHDEAGRLVFHTVRIVELNGTKKVLPVTPCTHATTGEFGWRMLGPDGIRPIYNTLEDTGQPTVLVVEGEKTADAARALFTGQPVWVTTSHGGSKSAYLADWSRLRGRKVVISHDLDASGLAYAAVITENARAVDARSVHLWTIPTSHVVRKGRLMQREDVPKKGYDLADSKEEGWTFSLLVTRQAPWHGPEIVAVP